MRHCTWLSYSLVCVGLADCKTAESPICTNNNRKDLSTMAAKVLMFAHDVILAVSLGNRPIANGNLQRGTCIVDDGTSVCRTKRLTCFTVGCKLHLSAII